MEQIDEILEFLHYHPNSKRTDVEQALTSKVSAATMKRILADGVMKGLVAVAGQGKATTYSIDCQCDSHCGEVLSPLVPDG